MGGEREYQRRWTLISPLPRISLSLSHMNTRAIHKTILQQSAVSLKHTHTHSHSRRYEKTTTLNLPSNFCVLESAGAYATRVCERKKKIRQFQPVVCAFAFIFRRFKTAV